MQNDTPVMEASFFHYFRKPVNHIPLPEKFTFPFDYIPHPLAKMASEELQQFLSQQTDWEHDFGIDDPKSPNGLGKMLGVLVVQNSKGELGYLTAFSGILAGQTLLPSFVPPVYDRKHTQSFYSELENEINEITSEIARLERDENFISQSENYHRDFSNSVEQITTKKKTLKEAKKRRKKARNEGVSKLTTEEFNLLKNHHEIESRTFDLDYKKTVREWKLQLAKLQEPIVHHQQNIDSLKQNRKAKSSKMQQVLFDQYQFLNSKGEMKGVLPIFESFNQSVPPAGAGDCAAPKLLHFAFANQLKPIALAEFWWGKSPKLEVRKHGHFYPSCKSKCLPILGHMLAGMALDENPVESIPLEDLKIKIIFEDDYLLVIHKPAGLLSVPGKKIKDSVETRMKAKFPEATGPILAHRLDMSTSGIMLLSKSLEIHQNLQRQFTSRTIKKRYLALLDGEIQEQSGVIELPIRVDIDNRPTQVVDFEHGKKAVTQWEVIHVANHKTSIYFYPVTGRTHQLRVHASHPKGLNAPIVGDELYGTRANRLHLQANLLEFTHPITQERKSFEIEAEF